MQLCLLSVVCCWEGQLELKRSTTDFVRKAMSELFDDVASLAEPLSMLRFTVGLEDKRFSFREPREPQRQSLSFTNHETIYCWHACCLALAARAMCCSTSLTETPTCPSARASSVRPPPARIRSSPSRSRDTHGDLRQHSHRGPRSTTRHTPDLST
jgi:hypothetical protein